MERCPVIDAHAHIYPPEVVENPRAWANRHNETHWGELCAPLDGVSLQSFASLDEMLRRMDEAEVDQVVLLGWYWRNPDTCDWHNRIQAEAIRLHPDRFIAFAACNPAAGINTVADTLQWAGDHGFRGVGELLPQIQGYSFTSPGFEELLDWCSRHAWPINLHVTEPIGHPYRGRVETPLDPLVQLARSHPGISFIFAHWGGLIPFYELNPRIREALVNVYYDTAASPLLYDERVFSLVLGAVPPEKILWGTDFPLRIYPVLQKTCDYVTPRRAFDALGLPETTAHLILGGNMAKLLNLSPKLPSGNTT